MTQGNGEASAFLPMETAQLLRQAARMTSFVSYLVPRNRFQIAVFYFIWMIFIICLYVLQKFIFDGGLEYGYLQPLRTVFVIGTPCILIGLSLAYKLEIQRREIERLAQTDALTGLLNRGAMDVLLSGETRLGQGSLLLIDIDNFKSVNDGLGHAVGDECLRRVAYFLRLVLPVEAQVARWGGEEFVALAPNYDVAAIAPFANLLVTGLQVRLPELRRPIKITLSLGVANFVEVRDRDALLRLADRRLYLAKSWGRARWVGPETHHQSGQ